MDKKAKKKLAVLKPKLQRLQRLLAGAKQQVDDPEEITQLEQQVSETEAEIEKLKAS